MCFCFFFLLATSLNMAINPRKKQWFSHSCRDLDIPCSTPPNNQETPNTAVSNTHTATASHTQTLSLHPHIHYRIVRNQVFRFSLTTSQIFLHNIHELEVQQYCTNFLQFFCNVLDLRQPPNQWFLVPKTKPLGLWCLDSSNVIILLLCKLFITITVITKNRVSGRFSLYFGESQSSIPLKT